MTLPKDWHAMSLDRLYEKLIEDRPTPKSIIDAVVFSVQMRGLTALSEPDTRRRLEQCDQRARAEIEERIAKMGAVSDG